MNAYDYDKHHTSCLNGQDVKFGWPIYTVFDEVNLFSGIIRAGFVYVESDTFLPLNGNGFYDADLVKYCLHERIVKKT